MAGLGYNGNYVGMGGPGGYFARIPVVQKPAPTAPVVAPTPVATRPIAPIAPPPQAGWTPPQPQSGLQGFDAIINGTAPQIPTGRSMMPNPAAPQQNFQQLGQDTMAQILQQQTGGM